MTRDTNKIHYLIYARKSSEDGDRQLLSIPAQLGEATRIVESRDLHLAGDPFTEEQSAKKPGRPVFNELLSRVEQGEANGIICWKLDRLARNPIDGGKIMDLLQRGVIKEILTPAAVYTPETNVIVLAVEFGMANQYIRDLSSNVKRGQRRKAEMGIPHGIAQIGFLNDKQGESGSRRWQVDELRFPLVKELLRRFLTGRYSVRNLWKVARDELHLRTLKRKKSGGKPLSLSYMYRLLSNPVYAGFFYYESKRYKLDPDLPRMITEDEYWRIQDMLGRKGRPRKKTKRIAVYSGFMRCAEYGCGVTADHKFHLVCSACKHKFSYINRDDCPKCHVPIMKMDNPTYRSYVYYQSTRARKTPGVKAPAIEESKVDEFLIRYIEKRFTVSEALSGWITKHIVELRDRKLENEKAIRRARNAAIDEAKQQRVELIRMRSKGMIGDEEFLKMKKEFERAERKASLQRGSSNWSERALGIVKLSAEMLHVIQSGTVREKREVLSSCGSNLVLKEDELSVCNTKPVQAFIDALDSIRGSDPPVEPRKIVDCSSHNRDFHSVIPSLCAGIETVRTSILQEMRENGE